MLESFIGHVLFLADSVYMTLASL